MKKKIIIIVIILLLLSIVIYINPIRIIRNKQITNNINTLKEKDYITKKDLIPFEYDEIHFLYPYTTKKEQLSNISENRKIEKDLNRKREAFDLVKEDIQVGQRANNDDLLKLDTILKMINYCKYNSVENKITAIDVSDISNYTLIFGKEGKKAYLGDASNLSERILWLKTILQKEDGNKGEIFINGDLNKDKVYFREEVKK